MGRTYKRKSNGQFAGGGGAGRLHNALAKGGIKTTKYKAAQKAQRKVGIRRLNRDMKSLLKMEEADMIKAGDPRGPGHADRLYAEMIHQNRSNRIRYGK